MAKRHGQFQRANTPSTKKKSTFKGFRVSHNSLVYKKTHLAPKIKIENNLAAVELATNMVLATKEMRGELSPAVEEQSPMFATPVNTEVVVAVESGVDPRARTFVEESTGEIAVTCEVPVSTILPTITGA